MDIAPGLRATVLWIRDSVDRFARKKNWSRGDYRITMTANVIWPHFIVNICAKEYDLPHPMDEMIRYDEAYNHLKMELNDDPGLYESIGVMICPFVFAFSNKGPDHENYVDIDDELLNPGSEDPRAMTQATIGSGG